MRRITQLDSRLQRRAYGRAKFWLSFPFLGIGTYFALAGFGQIPLPGKANAPLWVIGVVGLVFALGGLLLLPQGVAGLREQRRRARLDPMQRRQSWLLDHPWDPTGIRDQAYRRPVQALSGALLLGLFLLPFGWWAFGGGAGPLPVQILVGLFAVGFLLVSLNALYRLAQYLKYGSSELAFEHFPFAPGQPLEVQYLGPQPGPVLVTLRFLEERLEPGIKQQHLSVYEHYSARQTLPTRTDGAPLPIRFHLPDNRDWVNQLVPNPEMRYWELVVKSPAPGIDFDTRFLLPVYRHDRSQSRRSPPRIRSRPGRRFSHPYSFEVGLPLGLLGLAWLTWMLAPEISQGWLDAGRRLWQRQQAEWSLSPLPGIGSSAMAVRTGPDGRVWALTKYSLDRFDGSWRQNLLDTKSYRARFEHKVNALSSLLVTAADQAWVGSWYGELFHYQGGEWRQLSLRGQPLEARIYAMLRDGAGLLLASAQGLWRWPGPGRQLVALQGPPPGRAEAMAVDPAGSICAGIDRQLWCNPDGAWQMRWQAPGPILALLSLEQGEWLVGTRQGFYRVDAAGHPGPVQLAEHWITGFRKDGSDLWASTWNSGFYRRRGPGWHSYSIDDISELTLDPAGGLWLAVYSQGVLHIPRQGLAELLE